LRESVNGGSLLEAMAYRQTDRTRARAAGVRERILRAAYEQLEAGGYASATVSGVASRAGVATGSVYRHFPSKADLLSEVFRRSAQREVDAVVGAVEAARTLDARVAGAVEVFVRRALAAPRRAYALLAEPVDPAVEQQRLVFRRAYADVFASALRDAVEAGELEPIDADLVAAMLVGALGEALVGPLARHDDAEEALVASMQAFCLSAIRLRSPHVRHA
jgi:AcrR family transcriptional regulator